MGNGIIKQAFKMFWENKRVYLIILLIQFFLILPGLTDVNLAQQNPLPNYQNMNFLSSPETILSFLSGIIFSLISFFVYLILARYAYFKLTEENFNMQDNITLVASRLIRLVAAAILYYLIIFGGTILLIIPGIIFGYMFIFRTYGVLFENDSIIASLKRSKALTTNYKFEIFGTLFLFGLISAAFYIPLAIINSMIFTTSSGQQSLTFYILMQILGLLYNIIETNITVIWYFRLKNNYAQQLEYTNDAEVTADDVNSGGKPFCANCQKIFNENTVRCPYCGSFLEQP